MTNTNNKSQFKNTNLSFILTFTNIVNNLAPGGVTLYLPFILCGLCKDRSRTLFVFRNPPISHQFSFDCLGEKETISGVKEAINIHLKKSNSKEEKKEICLCGHSFGTFQLSWLLTDEELRQNIRQFILLDPVSILLSNPHVMINFLYKRNFDSITASVSTLVGSEICLEHYLRRHLAWYNCELWIEDIPDHIKVIISLSGKDTIIDASMVRREIEIQNKLRRKQHINSGDNDTKGESNGKESSSNETLLNLPLTLYWDDDEHGNCMCFPERWRGINKAMDMHI